VGPIDTTASLNANVNLGLQVAMAAVLLGGAALARGRRYRAHKYCQSAVLLLNLPLIAFIMLPSFHANVQPGLLAHLGDSFELVAVVHGTIGAVAELLGLYILLVAGTELVPQRLRFRRYKPWMRAELILWWTAVLAGIAVYSTWYVTW
jgi:uncharacterized membrane protein YozB (DUF420 family)